VESTGVTQKVNGHFSLYYSQLWYPITIWVLLQILSRVVISSHWACNCSYILPDQEPQRFLVLLEKKIQGQMQRRFWENRLGLLEQSVYSQETESAQAWEGAATFKPPPTHPSTRVLTQGLMLTRSTPWATPQAVFAFAFVFVFR
jgi:hypothetical protein